MPEKKAQQPKMNIVELLMWTELVPSKSQARRLVEQGAVKIDDKKVESVDSEIDLSGEKVLQVGKRRFMKVVG
jgi:tyrosyl-tRNA synthetase